MAQLLEFSGNHPILFAAFFGILGALIWTGFAGGASKKVTPATATRLINDEDAVVLDVRGEGEFNQGHIVNALHFPLSYLGERMDMLEKHRNKPILFICRTGQQASVACGKLRKNGYEKVFSVSGGILAWQDANLPLTKK